MQNKKRIKIIRIITRLNIGGPAVHAGLLTEGLNNSEFETRLIYGSLPKYEGDMSYILDGQRANSFYVSQLKREISPFCDIMAFLCIFWHILRYRPDIVHTHTAKAGALGRVAAILAGVPVRIHTFHGHVFRGYFDNPSAKVFVFLEKMLAKFTDVIVAISRRQRDDIIHKYKIAPPEKCRIVRLGFDLRKFLDSESKKGLFRKKFKFNEKDILIGAIGRLTAIKNHKMFIRAVAHIQKTAGRELFDRMKFIIVGDGELKEELAAYSRFNRLSEKISFVGWFKDIDEVYAGLDIVALTSENEGTPVTLIEALSSSKPVVSTDVGGVKDTVREAGILVERGDYRTLGDTILNLASSAEERTRLGGLGRDFVKETYSKERLVSDLTELYKNLLSRKGKAA